MRELPRTLFADARVSLRALFKRPGLAAAVAVTLALGVGTTAMIFSVVEGVILRPLPYEDPSSLVMVGTTFPNREWRTDVDGLMHLAGMSVRNFEDLRRRAASFERLAAVERTVVLLRDRGDGPERATAARVSADWFDILRVAPSLGRSFLAEDFTAAASEVVLLTHRAFLHRFGGDPSILGTPLPVDGPQMTVVGVLPADFHPPEALFRDEPDFWLPLRAGHARYEERGRRSAGLIGRLRGGVAIDAARIEATEIAELLAREYPEGNVYPDGSWLGIGVNDLKAQTVGGIGRTLLIFLGASGLLLLLSALNAAMLLLARALDRTRELGVRVAMGAGRFTVVRLLLIEAGLLSAGGGAVGVVLAYGGVAAFLSYAPSSIPRTDGIAVNCPVLLASVAVAVAAGMIAGLLPAIGLTRQDLWMQLRGGCRSSNSDTRLRSVFVSGQLAIAVLLLSGAGLLLSSFVRLVTVEHGFDPNGLLSMRVDLGEPGTFRGNATWRSWDRLLEEVEAIPGLAAVAGTTNPPYQSPFWAPWVSLPRDPPEHRREGITGYAVTPGYFEAVGTKFLQGRDFAATDGPDSLPVAIVNQAFVAAHLQGAPAVGATLIHHGEGPPGDAETTIAGVVENVVQTRAEEGARPAVYFPYTQVEWPLIQVVVRTELPAEDVSSQLRQAAARFDSKAPPADLTTMEARMVAARTTPRFHAVLIGSFALIALLLAASGLYGALAQAVERRRRELGIRIALGAARNGILSLVVAQGVRVALVGLAAGLMMALALTRLLSSFLYEVEPYDPLILAGVSVLLLLVAAGASLVPAFRATAVDPVEAIQSE